MPRPPWWGTDDRLHIPVDAIVEPNLASAGSAEREEDNYQTYRRGRLDERQQHEKRRSTSMRIISTIAMSIIAIVAAVWLYQQSDFSFRRPLVPKHASASVSVKGTPSMTIAEWGKRTDACLRRKSIFSSKHGEAGCYAGPDGQFHCTSPTFEEEAWACSTEANASGRPKGF